MTQATWNTTQPAEPANERSSEQSPTPPCSSATTSNAETFDAIYRQHFSAIAGHLYRRTGNQDLAEDLAADTFLSAWKALPRYQSTGVPMRSWLLRIATNKANALARRDRIRRRVFGRMPIHQLTNKPDDVSDWLYPALARRTPSASGSRSACDAERARDLGNAHPLTQMHLRLTKSVDDLLR
jgi:DNA-directed RNA polymerase specialized sigma24 family protein